MIKSYLINRHIGVVVVKGTIVHCTWSVTQTSMPIYKRGELVPFEEIGFVTSFKKLIAEVIGKVIEADNEKIVVVAYTAGEKILSFNVPYEDIQTCIILEAK